VRRDQHSIYCGVPRLAKGRQAVIRDTTRYNSHDSSRKPTPLRRPPYSRWGRRGFIGFLGAGNRIPISGCFIKWFWAGFAAIAAFLVIT